MLGRPEDIHPLRISVFFGSVDASARGGHAPGLIDDDRRWFPEVQGHELNLTIPANPRLDQVATIVVQTHGNQIPVNNYFSCGQSAGANVAGRPIELGIRQQSSYLRDAVHITIKIKHFHTHPTEIGIGPWVDIYPGCILVSSQNRHPVGRIQAPLE